MMKHIRIFIIVFLVVILALPLDALSCDDLKAIRDAAQQALDDANEELAAVVRTALALLLPVKTVPPPVNQGKILRKTKGQVSLQGLSPKGLTRRLMPQEQRSIKHRSPLTPHSSNSINV